MAPEPTTFWNPEPQNPSQHEPTTFSEPWTPKNPLNICPQPSGTLNPQTLPHRTAGPHQPLCQAGHLPATLKPPPPAHTQRPARSPTRHHNIPCSHPSRKHPLLPSLPPPPPPPPAHALAPPVTLRAVQPLSRNSACPPQQQQQQQRAWRLLRGRGV